MSMKNYTKFHPQTPLFAIILRALLGKKVASEIFLMTDDKKTQPQNSRHEAKPETELTPKQRAFIEEIVKGKTRNIRKSL